MVGKHLCYPDTRVLIFLPSRIPSVIYRVPENSNESDTRTRVHVTLVNMNPAILRSVQTVQI